MQQKEFTEYVIPRFIVKLPQFKNHLVERPGDIVNIEYKSNSSQLELWITTQDIEITIGLDGKDGLNHWHMHVTTYYDEFIDDDVNYASEIIENILNDKTNIIYSNLKGYTIADAENNIPRLSSGEIIEIRPWSCW